MWRQALEETRGRFEPRRTAAWGRWGVRAPRWSDRTDPLLMTYEHHERLFLSGEVVWGRVVKANRHLYERAREPKPGVTLYGLAPELDDDPRLLTRVADRCRALRSGPLPADGPLREFALAMRDDMDRAMQRPVPRAVADRTDLLTIGTMFHREHMPDGLLSGLATFPLLVDPSTGANLVLPWEYWSEPVLRLWHEAQLPPGVVRA